MSLLTTSALLFSTHTHRCSRAHSSQPVLGVDYSQSIPHGRADPSWLCPRGQAVRIYLWCNEPLCHPPSWALGLFLPRKEKQPTEPAGSQEALATSHSRQDATLGPLLLSSATQSRDCFIFFLPNARPRDVSSVLATYCLATNSFSGRWQSTDSSSPVWSLTFLSEPSFSVWSTRGQVRPLLPLVCMAVVTCPLPPDLSSPWFKDHRSKRLLTPAPGIQLPCSCNRKDSKGVRPLLLDKDSV